jgi:MYXO-CTERM domain-containing protein
MRRIAGPTLVLALGSTLPARAADLPADPSNYEAQLGQLVAGDTLKLAAGDYTNGMNLFDMNGEAGKPIVVEGPANGVAKFLGKSGKNTVDIKNSSYLVLRKLYFDGQGIQDIDAIKAGGQATDFAHHITIEGCTIVGHDGNETNQQTVGISTKIVAWDWVIRGNVIDGAGTGAYLGNSDGTRAFIGGLIEGNLFKKTLGYDMQIKHQIDRQQADVPTVPTDDRVTIIRHNVFIKQDLPSPDGLRPNLLTDGFPDSGPGSNDHYEIYGNFFFHNDGDALFQGNGRLHIHDNVFVDSKNPAIRLVNHSGKTVIDALVYNNTIYDTAVGISFGNAPSGTSFVNANAIFSVSAIAGFTAGTDNVTGAVADAPSYFANPGKTLGQMDFFPVSGSALKGAAYDLSSVAADADYDRDFNGTQKDFTYRGAYQGEGKNPGWALSAEPKPLPGAAGAGGGAGSPSGGGGGPSTGGSPSSGGAGVGGSAGSAGSAASSSEDGGGCGCRTVPDGSQSRGWLLVLALSWVARRRGRSFARAS